jgi:tetratricopeptide (TPR) repeat protein
MPWVRMMKTSRRISVLGLATALLLAGGAASAADPDALIAFELGRAALARGDEPQASDRFREACLAEEGLAEACLEWAELARARGESRDRARALGSAVMFAPDDPRARLAMAAMLLEKGDFTWAIEHLEAGAAATGDEEDRALLRYYLGYALFKNGDLEDAARQLALASRALPSDLNQKALYYRALVARARGDRELAQAMIVQAGEGPAPELSAAAEARMVSWSAFPRPAGLGGQLSASFGINTYPAVAFLDEPGMETAPALTSVFRGDLVLGTGGYTHGYQGMLTAYRDQAWVELGDTAGERAFSATDMNVTLFLLQNAFVFCGRAGGLEHELRIGMDGELQFLDHPPTLGGDGTWRPAADAFGLFTFAVAEQLWWSMAPDDDSSWSLRLRVEQRPNLIDEDRSTVRTRLRVHHVRFVLDRALQLKAMLGGRYDRSYQDPRVIKYDRLLPEARLDLRWNTPWKRLSVLGGGELRYNWYLNSRGNAANSFRPTYVANPQFSAEENAAFAAEYYDLTRHDFEWSAQAELQLAAWVRATLALRYTHAARRSNLDGAPVPMLEGDDGFERLPRATYGYDQDIVLLELTQRF